MGAENRVDLQAKSSSMLTGHLAEKPLTAPSFRALPPPG